MPRATFAPARVGLTKSAQTTGAMNQKNILPYDGLAHLVDDTEVEFEWPEISAYLAETIPWRIETAFMFGRHMPVPRMTAWFGDADYTYSGIRHRAAPCPAVVQRLRERAEAISGVSYNAVLLNLYRDGSDSVGWHSDNEAGLGNCRTIAADQAMRNAAEMALAEFNAPNVQLLVKDDAGNIDAARQGAQQALDEGAAIILGPLFAQSVSAVGQVGRARNVPVIAFSTDANVASRGVYLLSFLPESDVARIVQYAGSAGKRSYGALIPDNPYGTVVEAAFRQDVTRRGGQVVAIERYPHDKAGMAGPVKNVAQAAARVEST